MQPIGGTNKKEESHNIISKFTQHMNKTLLTATLLLGAVAQAQVGINTADPKATLHVKSKNPASGVEGIVYPHATQAEIESWNKADIEEGTIVWNTDQKCLEYFANNKWNNNCNGGGRRFIPTPGYKIGSHTRYLTSVRDDNYTIPGDPDKNINIEAVASWTEDTSSGSDVLLDHSDEAILNNSNRLVIAIPIEVVGSGTYNLQQYTSPPVTVTAEKTADGQARQLELYWDAQNVDANTKYIKAYIRTKSGSLALKRLDVQKGLGADRKGLELAKFEYFNDASQTTKSYVELRVVPVILDKYFGKKTRDYAAGGSPAPWANDAYEHQFIYFPVHSKNGFAYLQHNLGAEVTNVKNRHNVFNPDDIGYKDYSGNNLEMVGRTYSGFTPYKMAKYAGSLFQWQRMADGHELIDWMSMSNTMPNSGTLPASVYNGTVNYNNISGAKPTWLNARTNKQILNPTSTGKSWVHDSVNPNANTNPDHPDLQHWKPAGANMPCHVGYVIDDNIGNMKGDIIAEYQNIGGNNHGGDGFYNPFVITASTDPGKYSIGLHSYSNCHSIPSTLRAGYFFFNWGTTATATNGNGRGSNGETYKTFNSWGCMGSEDTRTGFDKIDESNYYRYRLALATVRCVQGH